MLRATNPTPLPNSFRQTIVAGERGTLAATIMFRASAKREPFSTESMMSYSLVSRIVPKDPPSLARTRYTDVKKSFSAACREASITDFRFRDLRQTFGTRLADAGVDVVKIKELMGHASIVTTMGYIHATDQGKRGAIFVLSEDRQKHCRKFTKKSGRA